MGVCGGRTRTRSSSVCAKRACSRNKAACNACLPTVLGRNACVARDSAAAVPASELNVCMYVCIMYVRMYSYMYMYVRMHVCITLQQQVGTLVSRYAAYMYVLYVFTKVCMYVPGRESLMD